MAGASLGMTNAILKRLAQKGWIVVKRLNSRNIRYAITPDGVNEIARRSYRYFKRTIKNIVFYRDRIDEAVASARKDAAQAVVLVGVSDLDFIVEHACDRNGLPFFMAVDEKLAATATLGTKAYRIYSESIPSPLGASIPSDQLYLSTILSGKELSVERTS
jgi:hypothetical protein